jgi:CRISPR/Cas system-associated exonuclease Cas4 (RecB family)
MPRNQQPVIRASEIGEYVYCSHSWWLRRVEGLESEHAERMERGTRLHRRHGVALMSSRLLLFLGCFLGVTALLLIFWLR